MYPRYKLPHNIASWLPQRVVYFDSETRYDPDVPEQKHELRLICGLYRRYLRGEKQVKGKRFYTGSPADFWEWVEARIADKTHLWVFAHNVDFDWAASDGFMQLYRLGWTPQFWAFSDRVWILNYRKGRKSLTVLDSMQYYPYSLERLGKWLKMYKLPTPRQDHSEVCWQMYCQWDVEILAAAMERYMHLVRDEGLGRFCLTLSGQSMTAFRHRYMSHEIELHRITPVLELEHSAYHGGRCEAFYIGQVPRSPVYLLDVNSMYPHAMKVNRFPTQLEGVLENPTPQQIAQQIERGCLLLDAEVEIDRPALAVKRDKVIFPVGRFRGVFTTPEVEWLLRHSQKITAYKMACYQAGPIFSEYVKHLWRLKRETEEAGDEITRTIIKNLLNSLYGKFAQRNPIIEQIGDLQAPLFRVERCVSSASYHTSLFLILAGKIYQENGKKWAKYAFPAISAHVTAQARLYLYELIEGAGVAHTFYCDTDSLMVDDRGLERLSDRLAPGDLGGLEVRQEVDKAVIYGAKDYELDGVLTLKGVPSDAVINEAGEFEYMAFERLKTRLRDDHVGEVHQVVRTRKRRAKYNKGVVQPSGWVLPFSLPL